MRVFRIEGAGGFIVYTLCLALAASMLPHGAFENGTRTYVIALGVIAIWRYLWGLAHFCRWLIYRHIVFPEMRRVADGNDFSPPHIFFMLTSFRIDAVTTARVYRATIKEAIACGAPSTIVASIVELGDEFLIKEIFRQENPPPHVVLRLVRIAGTGKRDGLAQGFRAISRAMPEAGSLVAVIDGDAIIEHGLVRKCAPFFNMFPDMGALTTDEDCDVEGSRLMTEWHRLRFAQRHILMSSMSLSKKVLTLTGRMSIFRAEIITHPDFIAQVETDSIDHWRLGHFKFLTGDDKSSWFWVLKQGYDMLYIPDVIVQTIEHPPSKNFVAATTALMLRWFGNMLRINGRALRLGPARMGLFTWWCILDQRISMWTSLTGPVFIALMTFKHSFAFIALYAVWIGFTRWVMALMLLTSRPILSWRYPFLIYYNQVWGACIKTFVLFRLDRQSWTRQKTSIHRKLTPTQTFIMNGGAVVTHSVAILSFIAALGLLAGLLRF